LQKSVYFEQFFIIYCTIYARILVIPSKPISDWMHRRVTATGVGELWEFS
jgi:hypothetical protein